MSHAMLIIRSISYGLAASILMLVGFVINKTGYTYISPGSDDEFTPHVLNKPQLHANPWMCQYIVNL